MKNYNGKVRAFVLTLLFIKINNENEADLFIFIHFPALPPVFQEVPSKIKLRLWDRTICIGDAMESPVPMKLSNFVDSITYVPLETTKSYVKNKMLISYVEPYWVVYPGSLFDKEGRFVTNIGALGQGRGEETNGWGYSVFYDLQRNVFYTLGDKIIQFDNTHTLNAQEVRISYRERNAMQVAGGLKNVVALLKADTKYLLVNYPDSIFWMDSDLEVTHNTRIIPDSLFLDPPGEREWNVIYILTL